uniref:GDT1 family protein n=1 Tax=Syphacia muris TaxID=451379 RepID=A0A0N5ADZ4_9BILA
MGLIFQGSQFFFIIAFYCVVLASCSEVKVHRLERNVGSPEQAAINSRVNNAISKLQANDINVDVNEMTSYANDSTDVSFYHALIASFSVIIVSELGDKTWFIATIMAMRHSRLTIFFGAMSALALMTILSALLGYATQVIPRALTYYISTALFALFGLKMLYEGYHMSSNEGHEVYEESNAEIQKKELLREGNGVSDLESGKASEPRSKTMVLLSFVSFLFLEAFTLTFLAEWGDRSQLTTIILAARENVYGVVLGGITGHSLCTGIAVIGGKLIATRISVKTVTLIGGVVFIIFALSALFINPQ